MNTEKSLIKSSLLLIATLCGAAYSCDSAMAQLTNPNSPAQPNNTQTNERSTSGDSGIGGFNPLDLIHNSNFRRSRDGTEFQEDTQNNINQAAEEFKRQQRERLQTSPTPDSTPTPKMK